MAKAKSKSSSVENILIDMLIVQCALGGLKGHQIREIAGVDMNRVSRILKHFKKAGG